MNTSEKKTPFILWLTPIILLLVAIFPLPYGYYTFLRTAMFIFCGVLIYWHYVKENLDDLWFVILGGIAVLYNPIIPIHLTKEIWTVLNLVTALALSGHWYFHFNKVRYGSDS